MYIQCYSKKTQILTLKMQKNARPRIFLYTPSWSWGYVYSSLNSAMLSCSTEVTLIVSVISGDGYMGFNNAVFLSERETADRNYSMAYYLKENRCFPPKTNLANIMDLYFQV